MSKHLGDFDTSAVIYGKFTTFRPSTGAAYTLGGTPALSVYKDSSTTQSTTGVTLTADFDSVTGLNHFAIDTSADGTFYSSGSFFDVVITTGTVDSVSVVGAVVGSFTLRKTSALKPTTAGRTLDVSAGGEAGLDWANVGSPTTSLALTGTTIATTQKVDIETIKTNPVVNAGTVTFPTTATLASTTNITAATGITVATNSDKTGYSLTQTFPSNFSALSITAGGVAKADLDTIKTQTVTCAGGVTIPAATLASTTNITAATGVDVTKWAGTTVGTPDTAGYPKVTIKSGTGTGEISLFGGFAGADIGKIEGSSTAADNLLADYDGTGYAGGTVKKQADVRQFGGSNGTFSSGRPEVNATHLAGTAYASADLSSTMKASVNAEVVDTLATDTYAEPGQAAPAATLSLSAKINYLFKAWRNKKTQTSSTYSLFADDATTVDQKATVSDDGTTTTVGEIASGP